MIRKGDRVDFTDDYAGPNGSPGTVRRVRVIEGVRLYWITWDDGFSDEGGAAYTDENLIPLASLRHARDTRTLDNPA